MQNPDEEAREPAQQDEEDETRVKFEISLPRAAYSAAPLSVLFMGQGFRKVENGEDLDVKATNPKIECA